jgi:hypothetical protein
MELKTNFSNLALVLFSKDHTLLYQYLLLAWNINTMSPGTV